MGRFEGAIARNQESTPQAEHAARLERKKLALKKAIDERWNTEQERMQRDRIASLVTSPDRFVLLSENECALAESLLAEHRKKPTKHVIEQLKEVQQALIFIEDHATITDEAINNIVDQKLLAQAEVKHAPTETPEAYRSHADYDPEMDAAIGKKKKPPVELKFPGEFRAEIKAEITAVHARNKQMLHEIEAEIGPPFHVEETGSILAILQRKLKEIEGTPVPTGRSEHHEPHRPRSNKPAAHQLHEPKVILSEASYKNPFDA